MSWPTCRCSADRTRPESWCSSTPRQPSRPPTWAPVRLTAPKTPLPVNSPERYMSWPTCRPLADSAEPESLRSSTPSQVSSPPMWAPVRLTALASPPLVALTREKRRYTLWSTCRLSADRAEPESLRTSTWAQKNWPPTWALFRLTAPARPLAVNPPERCRACLTSRPAAFRAGPELLRSSTSRQSNRPPIRAPVRLTAPASPLPVALNPLVRSMSWPTCSWLASRAGPESLRSFAPAQESWPPMWAPTRMAAPPLALPMIFAPARENRLQVRRAVSRGGSAGCSIWHPFRTTVVMRESRTKMPSSRRQSLSRKLTPVERFSRSSRPVIRAPRSRSPCGSGSAASFPRRMSRITVARQVRSSPHDRIAASSISSPLAVRSSHSPRPTCWTSDCSTEVNPPSAT